MNYNNTYISVCDRDRPERGCKKHITIANLEIDLITCGNWETKKESRMPNRLKRASENILKGSGRNPLM